ncbi:hypothetical protein M514_00171 [Trichuris suis]|uniref:Uncharacterized protein n=1 Tax=Trichuris suis TaxID=68888 RepID=A0A085MP62_9BILA|nr:hypothetical protein M513_00171 [Trichuris suis]KFD73040.1 hypothetical protein M514_00171 [Trichuris suis]
MSSKKVNFGTEKGMMPMPTLGVKVHVEELTKKDNWEFWKGNVQLLLEFCGLLDALGGAEKRHV